MKLIWYREAQETLIGIYLYYKEKSEKNAMSLYNDIKNQAEILINFPNIAPIEPLLSNESKTYRSLVVREHYKLIYHVDEEKQIIAIVRVWDCRQNPVILQIPH